jgi:hypothetical protein
VIPPNLVLLVSSQRTPLFVLQSRNRVNRELRRREVKEKNEGRFNKKRDSWVWVVVLG